MEAAFAMKRGSSWRIEQIYSTKSLGCPRHSDNPILEYRIIDIAPEGEYRYKRGHTRWGDTAILPVAGRKTKIQNIISVQNAVSTLLTNVIYF